MLRRSAVAGMLLMVVACGSEPTPVTAEEYLAALDAVCTQTTATLDALPEVPDEISVTDFAEQVAVALTDEAERARALDAPRELDADHRAFIRNTDEQAAEWRAIADGGDLTEHTGQFAKLLLGREDLVDEMGAPGCRRGAEGTGG